VRLAPLERHAALEAGAAAVQRLLHVGLVLCVVGLAEHGAQRHAGDVAALQALRLQARVVRVLAALGHVEVAHHRGNRVDEVGQALLAALDAQLRRAALGDVHGERVAAAHAAVGARVGDVLGQQVALDAAVAHRVLPLHALAAHRGGQLQAHRLVDGLAVHGGDVLADHGVRVLAQPLAVAVVGEAVAVLEVDVGDERGQVVGDGAQLLLGALAQAGVLHQRRGHRVEAARKIAELVLRVAREAEGEVAAADRGGRALELLHRLQHPPAHRDRGGHQHQQHRARRAERRQAELALRRAAGRGRVLEPLVGVVAHRLRVRQQLVEQRLLAARGEAVAVGGDLLQPHEQRRQLAHDGAQLGERGAGGHRPARAVLERRGDGRVPQVPLLGGARLGVAGVFLREGEQARDLVLGRLRALQRVARVVLAARGGGHERGREHGERERGRDEREELGADAHRCSPSPFSRRCRRRRA